MLKQLRNNLLYFINLIDLRLKLKIFPRDKILLTSSNQINKYSKSVNYLKEFESKYDMFYYCGIFKKNINYFYFQATKKNKNNIYESHIIILDSNRQIIFSIKAEELSLKHFYSPQIIQKNKRTLLYFCGLKNETKDMYCKDITDFKKEGKFTKLLSNANEQYIFEQNKTKYIFYTNQKSNKIMLKTTTDYLKFKKIKIKINVSRKYVFINNPCIIKDKNNFYLFCRISYKNAMNSKIICLVSKDLINYKENKLKGIFDKSTRGIVDNTGFPFIYKNDKEYLLFYTQYWGKHLLSKHTKKKWNKEK